MKCLVKNILRIALATWILSVLMPTVLSATNLTGTFKHPDGSLVNGKLIFRLSQPARLSDSSAQIVPMTKIFEVANGVIESGAFLYGNDALSPAGTYYIVRLVDTQNNLLFEQKWSIQGASLDLGTLTPTTASVLLPSPLLLDTGVLQAIQGPITFASPITAFSLTLNGNLTPGAAALYDLGSANSPWRSIHSLQWNNYLAPGAASGHVMPPAAAPEILAEGTGGTIPTGDYHVCLTNGNDNGETTCSPNATVSVTLGQKLRMNASGDSSYLTGAWWSRLYIKPVADATFKRQKMVRHTFNIATALSTISPSAVVRTNGMVVVTAAGHGIVGNSASSGWPISVSGCADSTFNVTTVVERVPDTNTFVYFAPGTNGSTTTCSVDTHGAMVRSNKLWIRTTAVHSFAVQDRIIISGNSGTGYDGTYRVWEVPAGNMAVIVQKTASNSEGTGGAAILPTGLDDETKQYAYGVYLLLDAYDAAGTAPPVSNTAAIDPLQVAVNAARLGTGPNEAGTTKSTVLLKTPATLFAQANNLTTPLILGSNGPIIEGTGRMTSDIFTDGISCNGCASNPDRGTVMIFGNGQTLRGVNVRAGGTDSHAIMIVGKNSNLSMLDFVARVASTTSTLAAAIVWRHVDESHNSTIRNFKLIGGRAGMLSTHSGAFKVIVEQFRIDCGGGESSSAFLHDGGPTDMARNQTGSVPSNYDFTFIGGDAESCRGPAFDTKHGLLTFRNMVNADSATEAGTPGAAIRTRTNTWAGGSSQSGLRVRDSSLNGHTNAWTTVWFASEASPGGVSFTTTSVGGSQTGMSNAVDFRGLPTRVAFFNTSVSTNEAATVSRVINISANAFVSTIGTSSTSGGVPTDTTTRTEITGRLMLEQIGNRANRKSLFMNGNTLETQAANDSTVLHTLDNSGNGAYTGTATGTRLISTISTGTAPLSITSSTLVPNLNSQLWSGKSAIDFSGALDYGAIAAHTCAELTIGSVTGAIPNNPVTPAWPAALEVGLIGMMFVSANDTVKVRLCNVTASSIDPANGQTFSGRVIK